MTKGLVIKNTGSAYVVLADDGNEYSCKVKGNFRLKGIRTTNPVAVGDHVTINPGADGSAYITEISPRRNYIIRRASNLSKESHIIAANLDQALLIISLSHPATSTTFIDRFLATAEAYRIPATIVINKTDIIREEPDGQEFIDAFAHLYRTIGYKVAECSAIRNEGIDDLRNMLKDKVTLLSGNSGVGKSSIINALIPGLNLRTSEISTTHLTGMHTTTFSEMFALEGGGLIIDTPGVKGFGTIDFDPHEVSHFFPEIFERGRECKFGDCSHRNEPGCAVREAVLEHLISESRYASYLSILEADANHEKYRKGF